MAADSHILEAESGSPQGQPEEEWTEEQIENALEHLKVLHIKARDPFQHVDLE